MGGKLDKLYVTGVLKKAGEPDENGDVFSEESLKELATKNLDILLYDNIAKHLIAKNIEIVPEFYLDTKNKIRLTGFSIGNQKIIRT